MNTLTRDPALSALIATLDALTERQVRRALIERLQRLARQRHLRMDAFVMNRELPSYLEDFYRAEQIEPLAKQLIAQPFWWIGLAGQEPVMLYDSKRRLLWDAQPDHATTVSLSDGRQQVTQLIIGTLVGWCLPRKEQLLTFATNQRNPLRTGSNDRLLGIDYWLCAGGQIDLDDGTSASVNTGGSGGMIACNPAVLDLSPADFIATAIQRGWTLQPCEIKDPQNLLAPLQGSPDLPTLYGPIDWLSARLPKLEPAQFTDPNKGLWEFWGCDAEDLREAGVRARNPAEDVKDWNVAIDFGTSSTVVAYDDNGQHKLLRIGVQDFWEKEQPGDYENPTLLEFVDLAALLDAWRAMAYRPGVLWDQVRCSHEALHNLRHNETNPRIVASVLAKLKQWAVREGKGHPVRITDRFQGNDAPGLEHELAPLTLRMPVKGQPLAVGPDDPFDPIELYAWFLGLAINWRGRGLFLRYSMTFPVTYSREAKEKILASFRRGLQRSLPASLVDQPAFDDFAVEELASEPAAYAAAALPLLGIEPTAEGLAYAVFDFGGGTADFDFGRYRLPDAEEEDAGWEAVFEHFGATGDPFLGGENLLENLAYLAFRHNLDLCRARRIAFTRPLDADDFPGSEMFLERTQAAQTNTLMLIARLRSLWETGVLLKREGEPNTSGVVTLELLDRDGQKTSCDLAIPEAALTGYLETRIEQGVRNFLTAMHRAFADQSPARIHVLLAGNASRSRIVARLFGLPAKPALPEPSTMEQPSPLKWAIRVLSSDMFEAHWVLDEAIGVLYELERDEALASALDVLSEFSGTEETVESVIRILSERSGDQSSSSPTTFVAKRYLTEFFGETAPDLQPHPPLPIDPGAVYRPTAKTGVALGLLRLCPGGVVKVVNHVATASGGEAPFAFHVGRERRGCFQVGLPQGSPYGEWHELGAPRERVFNLYYTQSPRAHTGEIRVGEPGLYKMRLDLQGELSGQKVFARATAPDLLDIRTAMSCAAIKDGQGENGRTLKLESGGFR
ncbi:hypothetical protein [uncultured Thiocystis sp.]|jgi:hypothetical protein|uniref:hypothetical protein n=1 Tax=uncultured Thiocystis sp. TaxID=1202134 RepID=UPI0025E22867|nr:hypothetical protein [uncultured Thiocystis sp.]